jgi:type IV secretory pathway VirB2 component (pilin)
MVTKITRWALALITLVFVSGFPFVANAAFVICGNTSDNPCTYDALVTMIQAIVSFVLTDVAAPIAIIVIVWGGIQMAISAGNEGKFKEGRKKITAAAVGLVITFGAWLLINTILKFLNIPTQ